MPKKGEIYLFKIYYVPIFMCGAETWSLDQGRYKQINSNRDDIFKK
jgi:hypothetical protein